MYSLSVCMSHIFNFMNIHKMKLRWNKQGGDHIYGMRILLASLAESWTLNTQEFKGTNYFLSRVSCYF